MQPDELAERFRQLNFSAPLAESVRAEMASASRAEDVGVGNYLFHEGTIGHELYLICEGRVGLDMNVPGRGAT